MYGSLSSLYSVWEPWPWDVVPTVKLDHSSSVDMI